MAEIIDLFKAPDGVDVTCLLSNGDKTIFHFAIYPEVDIQTVVDHLEQDFIDMEEKMKPNIENIVDLTI